MTSLWQTLKTSPILHLVSVYNRSLHPFSFTSLLNHFFKITNPPCIPPSITLLLPLLPSTFLSRSIWQSNVFSHHLQLSACGSSLFWQNRLMGRRWLLYTQPIMLEWLTLTATSACMFETGHNAQSIHHPYSILYRSFPTGLYQSKWAERPIAQVAEQNDANRFSLVYVGNYRRLNAYSPQTSLSKKIKCRINTEQQA